MKESTSESFGTPIAAESPFPKDKDWHRQPTASTAAVNKRFIDYQRYLLRLIADWINGLSLKTKWLIYTSLFIISFSVSLGSFFIASGKRNLERELQKWGRSLATNLTYSVYDDLLLEKYVTLRNYLLGLMNYPEIAYAAIIDDNDFLVAIEDPNSQLDSKLIDQSLSGDMGEFTCLTGTNGSRYYHFVKHIQIGDQDNTPDKIIHSTPSDSQHSTHGSARVAGTEPSRANKRLGTIILGISLETMTTKMVTSRNRAILITLAIALVFLTAVFWGVDRITTPIKKLEVSARRAAMGDLTHSVVHHRNDEIGSLAKSFNEMLQEIKRAKDIEKLYATTLEQQVNDRTRKLKKSEEKYRALFEHSGSAVILINEDNRIAMANQRFVELSGYSPQEIENSLSFFSLFPREDQRKIKEYFQLPGDPRTTNQRANFEAILINRLGHQQNINLTLARIPNSKSVLASMSDITALKELQRKLIRSEQLAAIGELSAAIAHEIRNPLGAINTSVGILKDALQLSGEDRELMEIISEETMRLNKIIEDFLQYANPKKLKLKETNINHLLQEILLLFRERLNNGIEQRIHLDAQLPLMLIDPNQIKQVLINIIKNAMEAMPGGGVLTILTRQAKNRSGQDMVEILVKDTGCGIDPYDLKKIFQPFYSTKEKGAGMGLAICERIAQNHGGEIKVESRAGKGALFLLTLPMKLSLT